MSPLLATRACAFQLRHFAVRALPKPIRYGGRQYAKETDLKQLHNTGLVNVRYPEDLRKVVERAVNSWKNFCHLPHASKSAYSFLEDEHGDGAGYELKEKKGLKKDLKENFHISLHQYERIAKIASNQTFPFLSDAKILLDKIEPLVMTFANGVERDYHISKFAQETITSKPYWTLRYLHYFGDQEIGSELAVPHVDKGAFTLHLYESDEGLEYFCINERVWKPMPMAENQTVIIPGIQSQWMSDKLTGLCHRVRATEKTSRLGRFSMVCFISFQNIPMYNKKKFGNMQSHPVGFNYLLPHQKLAKFFIPK